MDYILPTILKITSYLGLTGLGLGLFIEGMGLPFPAETLLVIFGYFSRMNYYPLISTIFAGAIGAWFGSLISFYLGRTYGVKLLYRYRKWLFLKEKHIDKTIDLSKKYGSLVLILGRFLPGVRTVSSYVAGIGGMKWGPFLIYSFIGFLILSGTWVGFGYLMAQHWKRVFHLFQSSLIIVALLLVMVFILYRFLRLRKVQLSSKK